MILTPGFGCRIPSHLTAASTTRRPPLPGPRRSPGLLAPPCSVRCTRWTTICRQTVCWAPARAVAHRDSRRRVPGALCFVPPAPAFSARAVPFSSLPCLRPHAILASHRSSRGRLQRGELLCAGRGGRAATVTLLLFAAPDCGRGFWNGWRPYIIVSGSSRSFDRCSEDAHKRQRLAATCGCFRHSRKTTTDEGPYGQCRMETIREISSSGGPWPSLCRLRETRSFVVYAFICLHAFRRAVHPHGHAGIPSAHVV